MKKILVFPGNQPFLGVTTNLNGISFGLNRDRNPDANYGR
jgi:hypothetical protein